MLKIKRIIMLTTLTVLVTTGCSPLKPMLADTDNKPTGTKTYVKTNDVRPSTQVNAMTPADTDRLMQQRLDKKIAASRLNQELGIKS